MTAAPRLVGVAVGETVDRWSDAGFTVTDGRVRVGPIAVRPGTATPDGLPALVFDRPHPGGSETLDGIAWLVDSEPIAVAPPAHPNGIDGTDHVVVMATDLARVRTALVEAGFEIRRERPTTMGTAAITQLFVWCGDVVVEVVAPTTEPTPGSARLWGLALTAPDIDATAAGFGDACGAPKPAVQPGRRIATVHHRQFGLSTTIAVMTPR